MARRFKTGQTIRPRMADIRAELDALHAGQQAEENARAAAQHREPRTLKPHFGGWVESDRLRILGASRGFYEVEWIGHDTRLLPSAGIDHLWDPVP